MICTRRHLFVHDPKTGGTTVEHILEQMHGMDKRTGRRRGHEALSNYLELREGRVTFGAIRAPGTRLVSWYCHARLCGDAGWEALRRWGRGSVAFADVVRGLCAEGRRPAPMQWAVFVTPQDKGARDAFLESGWGLMSWLTLYRFGEAGAWQDPPADLASVLAVDALIDTAQLREGLAEVLSVGREELDVHPDCNARLPRYGPADEREWYDPELVEVVKRAEAPLLALRGTPNDIFAPMATPVLWLRDSAREAA